MVNEYEGQRQIQIGNIKFISTNGSSQKNGVIIFKNTKETEILIDTIDYQQYETNGLIGNVGNVREQSVIRFTSAKNFNIQSIIASSSSRIKDQQQTVIFYIEMDYQNLNKYKITLSHANADLQSINSVQFLLLNGHSYQFQMTLSNISNGKSLDFGGCLCFMNTFSPGLIDYDINISNSTFTSCQSKYLGGAISNDSQNVDISFSKFENCSSQIGGAIFNQYFKDNQYDTNIFQDNIGYLAIPNFNKLLLEIKISEIYEINSSSGTYQKIEQFLYPGITYIIQFSLKIDGKWYSSFNENSFFGNLFNILVNPSNNFISITPPNLISQNFPYLIWYAQDVSFNGKKSIDLELGNINLIWIYPLKSDFYKIYNGCKEQGMEKIYLMKSQQFICKYCENMFVSYNGVCQQCQTEYFTDCYGYYSALKPSYWRNDYSIDSENIFFCSNNPDSCIGGSGIGNELCYKGHIGPQCIDCDVKGIYWKDQYSRIGFFQCVECNSISSNTFKISVLLVLLFLSLLVILVSTFRRLQNQIYAIYLSKMGIFFFGNTLLNQSLTSTYIKILMFHIQVYITQIKFTKIDIISTFSQFQFLLYNPLSSPFFSLNCLIAQYMTDFNSIGYSDLFLTFIIPIIICLIITLISIVAFLIKKSLFKQCVYTIILSYIYIFIVVFYSILLEKTLSSFFCLELEKNKSYSLIDLSLECGNSSELIKIQSLSLVILILFLIAFPLIIFLKLIQSRNRLKKVKVMFMYGFLYNEYKPKFFYWEMIRLLIKNLLVLLQLSLQQYPQISLIMISLMLFSYFIALKSYNPFISKSLNNLEKASIIISILLLQSSNVFIQQNQNESQKIESFRTVFYIIIQIINLMFFFYTLWLIITSFLEKQIQKLQKYIKFKCFQTRIKSPQILRINKSIKKLIKCTRIIKQNQILNDQDKSLIFYQLEEFSCQDEIKIN
ncbi:transmembrane protein, putative (macronuclear) [Tetrahymena thermophila SB210]|uniref:Transmembrane protein, putative n=1 Tax=Tetrahymena thermophila (strain SB210) TaxID=312017 RepID=I7LU74_TETTS|nr:transmembrane protein, putative [Tetrahymena thermophila SB210]EAR90741.2 transmembrane protein, putative [Tetrahymena thermophila SB210]|eukprot:XP_001010986.2 transmembrane protein, putative [Tetrahymena thermophila SB210]